MFTRIGRPFTSTGCQFTGTGCHFMRIGCQYYAHRGLVFISREVCTRCTNTKFTSLEIQQTSSRLHRNVCLSRVATCLSLVFSGRKRIRRADVMPRQAAVGAMPAIFGPNGAEMADFGHIWQASHRPPLFIAIAATRGNGAGSRSQHLSKVVSEHV